LNVRREISGFSARSGESVELAPGGSTGEMGRLPPDASAEDEVDRRERGYDVELVYTGWDGSSSESLSSSHLPCDFFEFGRLISLPPVGLAMWTATISTARQTCSAMARRVVENTVTLRRRGKTVVR
jgi:hypothetical protein